MKARADRPHGCPHGVGGLARGEAEVVDEDDHGPVLDAEAPECVIELVPGRDRRGRVPDGRPIRLEQSEVGAVTSFGEWNVRLLIMNAVANPAAARKVMNAATPQP